MIFVTFRERGHKEHSGDYERYEYAWYNNYSIAHYEDSKSITDKDMIQEVYGIDLEDEDNAEIFENNFDEDTNIYENYNGDWITVHKVQEMTQKELDVLVKMGVLYKWHSTAKIY